VIHVQGVHKTIDGVDVLRGIDLDIRPGEVFGVLGPNGAGKTTLLNMLAGLWSPNEGKITIDGRDRYRDAQAVRAFTFFLPDRPHAHPTDSGRDHLELIARVYGVPRDLAVKQIEDLATALDLTDLLDRGVVAYSNGQYRKLCLAGALISNAKLMILDEPFGGEIDPPGTTNLKLMLREVCRRRGVTCVLTTQIVALACDVCDRLSVLHEGKIKACGTQDEITAQYGVTTGGLERVLAELAGKKTTAAALDFLDSMNRETEVRK
jgi:ABC-2 type transport system ATP-binding protein